MEIIEEKEKKAEASQMDWPASRKALFFRMHRSTFYKHSKTKKYKFDFIKKIWFKYLITTKAFMVQKG